MRPIPEPIALDASVAEARERMREENLSFLPVVGPDNDKLLGLVLREVLERGRESSEAEPEARPLVRHLRADVDFCFKEEATGEVLRPEPDFGAGEGQGARHARLRRSLPVIVVDEQKVPLGYLFR